MEGHRDTRSTLQPPEPPREQVDPRTHGVGPRLVLEMEPSGA